MYGYIDLNVRSKLLQTKKWERNTVPVTVSGRTMVADIFVMKLTLSDHFM